MIDLERLITEKQDRLRGRPRDWIDDFGDWWRRVDWVGTALVGVWLILTLLALELVRP